ncbi:MAG: hypothetical protein MUC42_03820, partial [Bryobacter sp.]|nr:hypothetical protein [Bryobacter sp.]
MSAPSSKHFSRFLSNDGIALDILLVIALTAFLMLPWFQMGWNSNWGSIESTFIADAKFLKENWPRPLWQPNWYCGTRFDYVYPPALRFGTAGIARYTGLDTSRAYHIYTAFFYCLGIAGVYFLTRAGTRSRLDAWLAAAATTLVSSGLLFFADIRGDNLTLEPTRLSALVKYGEGPHMTALAWIPIALAAGWFALRRLTPLNFLIGAVGCAMVVSNNFYGATALAIFYPALVWAVWVTTRDARVPFRAAAIALAGYALTAWWLTPSFLKITLRNLQYVAEKGSPVSTWVLLAVVLAFLALTDRFFRNREEKAWTVFVLGAATLFTLVVIGFHWFGFRVIGEPNRLVPELDLVFIWLVLLAIGPMLRGPHPAQRWIAVGMLALAFYPGARFALKSRQWFPKPADEKQRAEYVTSQWMAKNRPG